MVQKDIYSAVDLSAFQFTSRCTPFNWRLLHGLDIDTLVRLNDTKKLESVIPALKHGSIDAEGMLSSHNYVQLFRLVQLAVEHLWQMRESHARLYPAYAAAGEAAERWKSAAAAHLSAGGQLLAQLQSESGAVLTEQMLSEVAATREELEKADGAYNTALDKLEAEDAAARCHSLRRQRLEISWRLVFGLDVQHMLITGSVTQLEELLPQVAYGNIMAENPAALTAAHFRQLVLLGQACLDYLHAICCATSTVLDQQVQQLASSSGPIPEMTTACEELRAALMADLGSSIQVLKAGVTPASPARKAAASPVPVSPVVVVHQKTAAACSSPSCHHVAHVQMTGHQKCMQQQCSDCSCGSSGCCCCQVRVSSPSSCCCSQHACRSRGACCCTGVASSKAERAGQLRDLRLAPAADKLQLRIEQLDRDIRHERECTHGMRQALEEITGMLQDLPSPDQPRKQKRKPAALVQPQQPPQQQQQVQQPQPHTVNVPVTISMSGDKHSRAESPPPSPGSPHDPAGAVRVLINEDTIRARERSAAGQQLSAHISDIIMGHHHLLRRSPTGSSSGAAHTAAGLGGPTSLRGTMEGQHTGPFVTVRSIPSFAGSRGQWAAEAEYAGAPGRYHQGDAGGSGGFMSGTVRGWGSSRSPTATQSFGRQQQGMFVAEEIATLQSSWDYVPEHGAGAAPMLAPAGSRAVAAGGRGVQQPGMLVGLGDFMIQQLQQQQQQQWPQEPQAASSGQGNPAGELAVGVQPGQAASPETVNPEKERQQRLFREAAAGGFRKLLRSVSPKRMFGSRPGSASAQAPSSPAAAGTGSPAAVNVGSPRWPPLAPAGSSIASSPDTSPTASGRSFTARAAARAAEELGLAAAQKPLTPQGQFSPLKASIVAQSN